MKAIPLTRGLFAFVDDEDFTLVSQLTWNAARHKGGGFYAQAWNGPSVIQMQRYILAASKDELVDHRNHDTLDNRRCNLRKCSLEENSRNRAKLGAAHIKSSRYKGVSWHKRARKWSAYIGSHPKISLGYFSSEEEAAAAYDQKAREMFGGFALANADDLELLRLTNEERNQAIAAAKPRVKVHWRHKLTPDSHNFSGAEFFSYGGQSLTIAQWAKQIGMAPHVIHRRIKKHGWTFERAITTPIQGRHPDPRSIKLPFDEWSEARGIESGILALAS